MNDTIDSVLAQFKHSIVRAIDAEVRRQITASLDDVLKPSPKAREPEKPAAKKRRGPPMGTVAVAKPCPVTGIPNTHRRFSYLMPEARTPENLAKYKKGGSK